MSAISQRIFDYESGYLSVDETVDLFQDLADKGYLPHLDPTLQHTATTLRGLGLIIA